MKTLYLIQGPPGKDYLYSIPMHETNVDKPAGTGKSETGAHLAYVFAMTIISRTTLKNVCSTVVHLL